MICLILFISSNIYGISKADSIRLKIKESATDLKKLAILHAELASVLYSVDQDSAVMVAQKGLLLSDRISYTSGIIRNCIELGKLALRSDSLDRAIRYYSRAARLIDAGTDKTDQIKIWAGLGYAYDLKSDFSYSLGAYMSGLQIAEQTRSISWKASFYNNIAIIYDRTGSPRKGLEYYRKAMILFRMTNDEEYYSNCLQNIGMAYKVLNMRDSAYYFFNKALPLQEKIGNYYGISNLYMSLGSLKLEDHDPSGALKDLGMAKQNIARIDNSFLGSKLYLVVESDYHMGRAFQQLKEYDQAIDYFYKVKRNAGNATFLAFETDAIKGISEVYEQTGRADSALKYAKLHLVLYDSLLKIEGNQRMAVIEYEYAARKEKAVAQEEKRRRQFYFFSFISLAFAALLLLFLLYLLQRNKTRRIDLMRANLQLEKSNLEKDLDLKNRDLTSKVMTLVEKNEMLAEVSTRLKKVLENKESADPGIIRTLVHDLQHQQSEGFWEEFNIRFKEIHTDFYNRISKDFPSLTPNEIKLCAFLKLNLSTKEISLVTKKSEHSIKIARYRLRRKLNLVREENLTMFLGKY